MSTWTTYRYIYIDTYIHRYSEFAICYCCIRGLLRLAPNYRRPAVPLIFELVIVQVFIQGLGPGICSYITEQAITER